MAGYVVIKIGLWAVLLLASAFCSAAEGAFTSLTKFKVKNLAAGPAFRKKIALWFEHSESILITILIVNSSVNIAVTMLTFIIVQDIAPAQGRYMHYVLAVVCSAVAIIFFCEIIPKMFGRNQSEKITMAFVPVLYALSRAMYWVNRFFIGFSARVLSLFGVKRHNRDIFITAEEIHSIIEEGERAGALEEGERRMIKGVFELSETAVREVMVPRMEVIALASTSTVEEAIETIIKDAVSRVPVYEEDIDHITGVLYARDIFTHIAREQVDVKATPVSKVMHEPFFVPETKPVDELLKEFQHNKKHMAVVIDEYGGTAGIVTIEDILEEIVGEIHDEYDVVEEKLIRQTGRDKYIVDGRCSIADFEEHFGGDFFTDDENFDTIGGFLSQHFGRIPREGESAEVNGVVFIVTQADERRILKVEIERVKE